MQPILRLLLSELHESYFKPSGFSKGKQRFRRDVGPAMQEVYFQSSQWNSQSDPIRFYVEISVGFADIPIEDGKPALTGSARLPGLVPEAPPHHDLTRENHSKLRDELLDWIPRALALLPDHYEDVRSHALRGSHCVLPVPASWRSEK
jgi:hypothetical protein